MKDRRAAREGAGRHAAGFLVLYLGLMVVLLIEQFVLRLPPKAYVDVAGLFVAVNVVLALRRARAGVLAHGTLLGAIAGVLPVAFVGTVVGAAIVMAADSEPTVVGVVVGGVAFLVVFVLLTAGLQYRSTVRDADPLQED